jgi:uncharacterized PurR-regulated membrane protein YhhQ (DUF165 family)
MLRRIVPLVGYIAVIVLANWAIQAFGLVPVGLGLYAPAGVYFAGLAFTLRDLVQEQLGRAWTIGAILIGALLSAAISPQFALAAGPRSWSRSWPISPSTRRSERATG